MNDEDLHAGKCPVEPPPSPDRIMRLPEVVANTGLKKATIYKRLKERDFPRSIDLGGRAVGWSAAEIAAWVEERKASRP